MMFHPVYLRQPREVSIETYALCNAKCEFCPYPTLERKGTRMTTADVFKLLEQMKAWAFPFFISPFKVNEPFLDDRLEDFCRYIDRNIPNAVLRLFSNGSPLIERHLQWVSELRRVEHLWISLNEVDPLRYRAVMGLDLMRTLERLDALHERVKLGKFPHRVVVSRVGRIDVVEDNVFTEHCREGWPRFYVRLIKRDAWIDFTNAADESVPLAPCGRWWELNICADGKAALCCMDGTGEYAIGDANTTSLLDIYNQPQLVTRRNFTVSRKGITPCER